MIRFKCDACGKQLNARDEHAGKGVKCPGCGKALTVPGGGSAEKPKVAAAGADAAEPAEPRAFPYTLAALAACGVVLLGVAPWFGVTWMWIATGCIVLGTTIWVGGDASANGVSVRPGQPYSGALGWVLGCFLPNSGDEFRGRLRRIPGTVTAMILDRTAVQATIEVMPRQSRFVLPGLAHHVTQRGARRGQAASCGQRRLAQG